MPKTSSSRRLALDDSLNDNNFNRRHIAFVREYFKDRNATQAALRAGYSPATAPVIGHNLLRKGNVARHIRDIERQLMIDAVVDEVWVIQQLKENAARAIDKEDYGVVTRCLELIGKHIGMFVERSSLNVNYDNIERIERRIVDPEIIDVDYSVDDKKRED